MTTYVLHQRKGQDCCTKTVTTERQIGDAGYAVICPWHEESTPSCALSLRLGYWYCFGCGAHGVFDALDDEARR
jgi:DNA primase